MKNHLIDDQAQEAGQDRFSDKHLVKVEAASPEQSISVAITAELFPPLELVNRPTVTTAAAAFYLNRKPQTLRGWACAEDGPLRPLRVHGRLAWPVSELRRILGVAQ